MFEVWKMDVGTTAVILCLCECKALECMNKSIKRCYFGCKCGFFLERLLVTKIRPARLCQNYFIHAQSACSGDTPLEPSDGQNLCFQVADALSVDHSTSGMA